MSFFGSIACALMVAFARLCTMNLDLHLEEFDRLVSESRAPRLRSMGRFAEEEIVLPDSGPLAGAKFRCEAQPFSGPWFDAVGSGQFNRFVATGCSQSGKTLCGLVIPLLYHLFERRETCILFAPSMDVCEAKWVVDILPTIQRSRFAELLPKAGRGSRGAFGDLIAFRNGARLKSMSAGGSDSSRAAFTAKVALGTEIDDMAEASETSVESDPISQIAARLRAHGQAARMYLECTVTTPRGEVWRQYLGGTASRLVLPCPHCFGWVSPERDDFVGWDAAETELQAEQKARFSCPKCGGLWSPDQRTSANRKCRLLHRGQEITPEGEISGPTPETRTFSLRWSAVNNSFATEAQLGNEEWNSAREEDRENAEKRRCQQVWVIPYGGRTAAVDLTAETVASRLTELDRGVLPNDVETLVVQIDVHDRWLYWTAMATGPNRVRYVVDYGLSINPNIEVNGPAEAIRLGLTQIGTELSLRTWQTVAGDSFPVDMYFVDAGYVQGIGLAFVTDRGSKWRMVKGSGKYTRPEPDQDTHIGENWHDSRQPACEASCGKKWWLAISDTNFWLHQVHAGFASLPFLDDGTTRRPGSIAIFGSDSRVHLKPVDHTVSRSAFATQICAWKWQQTESKRRGTQMEWVSQYGQDHWLDTTYGCFVADKVVRTYHKRFRKIVPQPSRPTTPPLTMLDGRPWLANAMQ